MEHDEDIRALQRQLDRGFRLVVAFALSVPIVISVVALWMA